MTAYCYDDKLTPIMRVVKEEILTARIANDIFEKAGSSVRVVENDVITDELRDQLWDAAVKIGLIDGGK